MDDREEKGAAEDTSKMEDFESKEDETKDVTDDSIKVEGI